MNPNLARPLTVACLDKIRKKGLLYGEPAFLTDINCKSNWDFQKCSIVSIKLCFSLTIHLLKINFSQLGGGPGGSECRYVIYKFFSKLNKTERLQIPKMLFPSFYFLYYEVL